MSTPAFDLAGLYASEQGRLKRLVKRLVGSRTTADDLVQQAFLKLIDRTDLDDLDNCPAYLTVTVRNLAINHLRNATRRSEVDLSDTHANTIADTSPSPELATLYRSELRRVLEAIATLPTRRREAFVLNKFEGMSYDEIALHQGISRNTVISQIVSALADLDRKVGPK